MIASRICTITPRQSRRHRLILVENLARRSLRQPVLASSSCFALRTSTTGASTSTGRTPSFNTSSSSNTKPWFTAAVLALTSLSVGYAAGRAEEQAKYHRVLPDGLPRTCCDNPSSPGGTVAPHAYTAAQQALPDQLRKIVGKNNVLDGNVESTHTLPFLKGARLGFGHALAIVTPESLQDVVDCVQAIVNADCVALPQGRNTGLTGGSVPHSHDTRPTVVLSLKRLDRIFPLDDGNKVVCLAGVGLASLEQFLKQEFPDRESHSILGSTFLNPTTAAGVAFGSGGTQLRKGPAYTERALYLKICTNKWNEKNVEIVDTLGIEGMEAGDIDPHRARKMDSIPSRLDRWSKMIADGYAKDMRYSSRKGAGALPASDTDYARRLCQHDTNVSRYNADTRGPDLCRSEGKIVILATVHDTFPKPKETQAFWIGFDTLETALDFRKQVCLNNPKDLPVSMEYMDRDAFDVVDRSGRLLGQTIKLTGPSSPIVAQLWGIKLFVEALPLPGASLICDKALHWCNNLLPATLPKDILTTGRTMHHHVAMTVGEFGDGNMERLLHRMQDFAKQHGAEQVKIHKVQGKDLSGLTAFRFVAAPAFRTWCVGEGVQGFSVDYALPKNAGEAPKLGQAGPMPLKRMRYSHFGCNVVHEDLAYANGVDIHEAKHDLKKTVEFDCQGRLPAEHGHGREYVAPPDTQKRWQKMDPLNVLNPGVGGLSEKARYSE
jgi:D-lactate dehydrogenase